MLLSVSSRSARRRSFSSGAVICKKLAAPYFPPIWNRLASPNRKEEGTIKSLTDRPEGASHSHAKENRSPSGWRTPCSTASHSFPSRAFASAPIALK